MQSIQSRQKQRKFINISPIVQIVRVILPMIQTIRTPTIVQLLSVTQILWPRKQEIMTRHYGNTSLA